MTAGYIRARDLVTTHAMTEATGPSPRRTQFSSCDACRTSRLACDAARIGSGPGKAGWTGAPALDVRVGSDDALLRWDDILYRRHFPIATQP